MKPEKQNYCRPIKTVQFLSYFQRSNVCHMTGSHGQERTAKVIVGVGNGNGSFGYAMASSRDGRPAVRRALNRAAQRLLYVHRFEDRTSTYLVESMPNKDRCNDFNLLPMLLQSRIIFSRNMQGPKCTPLDKDLSTDWFAIV